MVRLILYSLDAKLPPLLAPALKPEYSVTAESNKQKLRQIAASGQADVLILDMDSNYSSLPDQLALYDEIGDSPIPIVVMTDNLRRSVATEFMQRGAFDCIRKPPSLVEIKV